MAATERTGPEVELPLLAEFSQSWPGCSLSLRRTPASPASDLQRLRLDIPDSVVDGGDGLERGAFAAVAAHPPEHVVPDLLGLEWVCTDYQI